MTSHVTSTRVMVEHVALCSTKSFEALQSAAETSVPVIDLDYTSS